jgi:hypothetical protein
MALFYECMLKCAQKLLDTADIVRDAIFQPLARQSHSFRLVDDTPLIRRCARRQE